MSDIWFFLKARALRTKVKKVNFFTRGIGLMFSSSKTENLLFTFGKRGRPAITSIFVFYPFLAIWLDEHNRVVDYNYVRPFTLSVRSRVVCTKLIELPLNSENAKFFSIFRR